MLPQEILDLLNAAKNTIDHARKWRTNADPDFKDTGVYRKVSEQIKCVLDAHEDGSKVESLGDCTCED